MSTQPESADRPLSLLRDGPKNARATFIIAHGSGQGMESPFLTHLASHLAYVGITVVRFEFAYMRLARATGKQRPPDREPKLMATWQEVIATVAVDRKRLFIGGRSMGGRIAMHD